MKRKMNRRSFLKTAAGVVTLNELMGLGILSSNCKLVSAADRRGVLGASFCDITPVQADRFYVGCSPINWTLTYTAGLTGLRPGWALVIRCPNTIKPEHNLLVTPSLSPFSVNVLVKNKRFIWIETGTDYLPEGESLTITLEDYFAPRASTACAFTALEMNPDGNKPELGSGYTFTELSCTGGHVLPLATATFHVNLPTRAKVGDPVRIRIAALDEDHHPTPDYTGVVNLSSALPFYNLPQTVTFTPGDQGSIEIQARPKAEGVIRLDVTDTVITSQSNPCVCTSDPVEEMVLWGDYHSHTRNDDGFLLMGEDYDRAVRYAFLDWGMYSSHDMMPYPNTGAHSWDELQKTTEEYNMEGDFVTFQGYEWSFKWPFSPDDARGHKVVFFLNPQHLLPLIPCCKLNPKPEYMPPTTLMDQLRERAGDDVIVVPHHLPIYKWWRFLEVPASEMGGPLPEMKREEIDKLQPVAEVYAGMHGQSESEELLNWIKPLTTFGYKILATFWQDGLKKGVRTGAMAASDNHVSGIGLDLYNGKTAVMTTEHTREGIFRAIQKRRTYAVSGPRIFIDFRLGSAKMGDMVFWPLGSPDPTLEVNASSPVPIDYVEIVKVVKGYAEVAYKHMVGTDRDINFTWTDPLFNPHQWACYYLRFHLDNDTHGAWTSPIWLDPYHRHETA